MRKTELTANVLPANFAGPGHVLVEDVESADAGIVNTCGFIRPAVEESIAAILDLERLKLEGET